MPAIPSTVRQIGVERIVQYVVIVGLAAAFAGILRLGGRQNVKPTVRLLLDTPMGLAGFPTLLDFWDGQAQFILDVPDTGLPMGESESWRLPDGRFWSYLHASAQSVGAVDQCDDPVEFPGCTVIYRSEDGGVNFSHETPVTCQFACQQCPCDSFIDHIDQQQYPDIAETNDGLLIVYEYRGRTILRRSPDGLNWSIPEQVAYTGHWRTDYAPCRAEERIGQHPFVPYDYECLAGAPPGIFVEGEMAYVFVGLGQNPGRMGCFKGLANEDAKNWTPCLNNPLFVGAESYGGLETAGVDANPFFDFRTVSSAELVKIADRYYMLYEGVRGPGPFDGGDSQFALGLARSKSAQIDGAWEKYPGNPILVDLPGNVGLGHADLISIRGETFLYTSLDGVKRSRLRLVWN